YKISEENFNDYKVLPRLFFGKYLSGQFDLLLKQAKEKGIETKVHLNSNVIDIIDQSKDEKVLVITGHGSYQFDHVVICTGHNWPSANEDIVPNYFDSPYPPSKLALQINYPVAVRGSSLTAIDAIRTLSRHNGHFTKKENGIYSYTLNEESRGFKLVMHSREGMLPAIRFHLEDTHLGKETILSEEEVQKNMQENDGFLSLDYVFQKNFKESFREQDPEMYERIKDMTLEVFVDEMMALREKLDAFTLFKAEYAEAEKSIQRKKSVYWKEMLAVLSFAMNYPAKHFSAEDMLRLQQVLMPLISVVIAFVPQSSSRELIALHDAGLLDIVPVGHDSYVEPAKDGGAVIHFNDEQNAEQSVYYKMFVDCIGQPHLHFEQFPFKSLRDEKVITPALLKFRSYENGEAVFSTNGNKTLKSVAGDYYLKVPGIAINDHFQVVDTYGAHNPRIYIMAVPYIGGYNPDYSGLDFSEAASAKIASQLFTEKN
ncbi:MAG: FAD/NAD(P)-binding protein, partial [Ginsengibacter sp.]